MFIDKKTLLKFVNLVPVIRGITKEGEVSFQHKWLLLKLKSTPKGEKWYQRLTIIYKVVSLDGVKLKTACGRCNRLNSRNPRSLHALID